MAHASIAATGGADADTTEAAVEDALPPFVAEPDEVADTAAAQVAPGLAPATKCGGFAGNCALMRLTL